MNFFGNLVRLYHSKRVFEIVKTGNLKNNRTVPTNTRFFVHGGNFRWIERHVLFAQRIDAGRDDEHRVGQGLCKIDQGKDTGVIVHDIVAQIFPYRPMRMTDVYMTSPYPFAPPVGTKAQKRRRLGVMNEHNIGVFQCRAKTLHVLRVGMFINPQQ